jgi:hypothetical protein
MQAWLGIPTAEEEPPALPVLALTIATLAAFGIALGMTILWTTMRDILALGGMVAKGGPYEIEHPAPDWVEIVPAAIVVMMACLFINAFAAIRLGRLTLMLPTWTALFASLGWNFLVYGLHPPVGFEGVVVPWLVCAVTFFLLSALGVAGLVLASRLPFPIGTALGPAGGVTRFGTVPARPRVGRRLYAALNVLAVAGGVLLGLTIYWAITS